MMDDDIELLRGAVEAMEAGDTKRVDALIKSFNDKRFENLFAEIGRLMRSVHDDIRELISDDRLHDLADTDIPNCHERLSYVMAQTEQAANLTLDEIDVMLPITESMAEGACAALTDCNGGQDALQRYEGFAQQVRHDSQRLRDGLSQIMVAQTYQDLTSQVIKRTIEVVTQVERQLLDIVSACGATSNAVNAREKPGIDQTSGSHGPTIRTCKESAANQDEVDDLLANLGF